MTYAVWQSWIETYYFMAYCSTCSSTELLLWMGLIRKNFVNAWMSGDACMSPGKVGQAHVHKISYSEVGQWKLVNRSVMITRNWTQIDPQVKINIDDKCSFSMLNWFMNPINDLVVMWHSELVLPGVIPLLMEHTNTSSQKYPIAPNFWGTNFW